MRTAHDLIERPERQRPHAVVLGAGASVAAFPQGDATGRRLPVMHTLAATLGLLPRLEPIATSAELEDFELLYARLRTDPAHATLCGELEAAIHAYFSAMQLPTTATLYDVLLLSLTAADAVFSFNWDPFLFDAYARNAAAAPMPRIYFLHGNVRLVRCATHHQAFGVGAHCPTCDGAGVPVPLLYPVAQKHYAADPYIADAWEEAQRALEEALTVTFFGYGAPDSDVDAVRLLESAWLARSERTLEHVSVIDIAPHDVLHERWRRFVPTGHLQVFTRYEDSFLGRWPRRSTQAIFHPMSTGMPCVAFPWPPTLSLTALQATAAHIAQFDPS